MSDEEITAAMGVALKLHNQKNGWKGVLIYHETNGDPFFCLIKAIGRGYIHLCTNGGRPKTYLSTYFEKGLEYNITAEHNSKGLKMAAAALNYPFLKGILIKRIGTHSLCSGRANCVWSLKRSFVSAMMHHHNIGVF